MGELKFEVKLPIFVERQWVRHRTCSMNEMSGRYSEMPEEYHVPDTFRMQDTTNKQSTVGVVGVDGSVGKFVVARQENARRTWQNYHDEMAVGVGREQAREMLPLATYTKKVWKMDLHNLFHFLKLRTDEHAQWEIRQYANELEKFVKAAFPWSYASWKNHIKDAVTFSADEWQIITELLDTKFSGGTANRVDNYNGFDCLRIRINASKLKKTRKAEFLKKLGCNE
jgi:thymidylate synthase (FAD)